MIGKFFVPSVSPRENGFPIPAPATNEPQFPGKEQGAGNSLAKRAKSAK